MARIKHVTRRNKQPGIRPVNPVKVKRKLFQYSPVKVGQALKAIREGMPVATASKTFQVPRSTLRHKVSGTAPPTTGRTGPTPVLGIECESLLVDWIKNCARMGFPITKACLLDSVSLLIKTAKIENPFSNGVPGKKWFQSFMKRNPDISQKHAEYINNARAAVTEEKIRLWFRDVTEYLGENVKILEDPTRIFNMDETAFYLSPVGSLVLAERGKPVYDTFRNSDKDNITTLITVSAAGCIAPSMTVFKYERIPTAIPKAAPKEWGIGKTENGWMTGESFYEYFANIFQPYLEENQIPLPVIVFFDGHTSHLTLPLSNFCRDNQIILVCLPPNTTHIMQPLDVSFFFPLKHEWRNFLRLYRHEHSGEEITKYNVIQALSQILNKPTFPSAIRSGFATCGIFPFNPDNVNYGKCTMKRRDECTTRKVETAQQSHLSYLESKIEDDLVKQFQHCFRNKIDWAGDYAASSLFDV